MIASKDAPKRTRRRRRSRPAGPALSIDMNAGRVFSDFAVRALAPRLRTMREFAEQEITLPPGGPFAGRRFRCDRQPFAGVYFDLLESGTWPTVALTGPTQTGKTLLGVAIPTLYHVFECQEPTIMGLPDMDMAGDKWRRDILPVFQRTKYRHLLPSTGAGARGGKIESITFANGIPLKFMSGGGGDKSRAGYTAPVLVATEIDGYDTAGTTSREADKLSQMIARTRAFLKTGRARVYLECTMSIETGRINVEYTSGTETRLAMRCPKCREWVTPERKHLIGWQAAENELEAFDMAAWSCPSCGKPWTEQQRERANRELVPVHRGQTIDKSGRVHGDPPPVRTLGFRWSAVHNLLASAGDVGVDEWSGARSPDEDNSEKKLCQFVHAMPWAPADSVSRPLTESDIMKRAVPLTRGVLPNGTEYLTAFLDVGKWLCHWVAIAWRPSFTGHIVDYGRIEVATDQLGFEAAIKIAMAEFREHTLAGWNDAGQPRVPDQVWIDAGYQDGTDIVYRTCREFEGGRDGHGQARFRPSIGRGTLQYKRTAYRAPRKKSPDNPFVGDRYHVARIETGHGTRIHVVEIDVDAWKSFVDRRLRTPPDQPGAMTIFHGIQRDHFAFAKHITAERKVPDFDPKRGAIERWESVRRSNHWFDGVTGAAVAAHFCGARLTKETGKSPEQPTTTRQRGRAVLTADGQPFLATER